MDELGLVQAVDGLGQGVVVGVADGPDGRGDAVLGQGVGVREAHVLAAAVAVMDQSVSLGRALWQMAWFRASRTKPVFIDVQTRQPTIFRAKTSMTNATYTMPCQLET